MRLMVLTAALAAIASSASAGDLRFVFLTKDSAFLVDLSSVRGTGARKFAWTTTVFKEPDENGVAYVSARKEFDCDGERSAFRNWIGYDTEGSSIQNLGNLTEEFDQVIPDTGGQAELEMACRGEFLEGYEAGRALSLPNAHTAYERISPSIGVNP